MTEFYKGMDVSFLPELEDKNIQFYDSDGKPMDVFSILEKYGVNSIRLRIWNEPERVPEAGGYCNLAHTVEMARRIKAHHMHFVLDFHYSDYWADPGQQNKPFAWKGFNFEQLKQAVYDYTYGVLDTLQKEGILPDMVQVGNEIRSGMLFPDGAVPAYGHLSALVNAGIRAVREISKDIKVVIHLDQGGRFYYLKEWFDSMFEAGMEAIDGIGISFYSFWHGTFMDLRDSVKQLIEDYHLPVYVMETAHPWRICPTGHVSEDMMKTAGLPAGIEEQKKSLEIVMQIMASMPDGMGMGVYYWEPVGVPDRGFNSWCENMCMFDAGGKVLPGIQVYRDFTRETKPIEDLDSYIESLYEVDEALLPPAGTNLVPNGDFAEGDKDWWLEKTPSDEVEVEFREKEVYVAAKCNYTFQLFRDVYINKEGRYQLSVEYRGTNTTGVKVQLFLNRVSYDREECFSKDIFPGDVSFVTHELEPILLPSGQVRVGIRMETPPVFGRIRNMRLVEVEEEDV